MDNSELVQTLRSSCMLIFFKAHFRERKDVDDTVAKQIATLQREASNIVGDSTLMFGDRRLLMNVQFEGFVGRFGKLLMAFKGLLDSLPAEARSSYQIEMGYEPLPAPDGFGMMSERASGLLDAFVRGRIVKLWVGAHMDIISRTCTAVDQFATRLNEYDRFDPSGPVKRAIIRSVVADQMAQKISLLETSNIDGNTYVADMLDKMTPLRLLDIEDVRRDQAKRTAMIELARECKDALAEYRRR